jgi:hypothetical protein
MAKVYSLPAGFEPPDFGQFIVDGRYDREADDRLHKEFIDNLATYAREHNSGDMVGEVVRFPAADGYAQYMVWSHKPLSLIHLPIHDAWQIPEAHARGLRLADIRAEVAREKRLAELFASKRA